MHHLPQQTIALLDDLDIGTDINVVYRLGSGDCIVSDGGHGEEMVMSGRYGGLLREPGVCGEWRLLITSPNGNDTAVRMSRIVRVIEITANKPV